MQIEAVVRRVVWLVRQDCNNKVLVFSTWAEVLLLLEHALRTNGVPYARARSSKTLQSAITTFRKKPAPGQPLVQTLLLLLKQGANGLNLTGQFAVPQHCRCMEMLHMLICQGRPKMVCSSARGSLISIMLNAAASLVTC
jgi:hypothetical protein